MTRVKKEEITTLQVVNADDPEDFDGGKGQRVLGIMVPAQWWAEANPVARQMMWLGIATRASETWAEQDAERAKAQAAPVSPAVDMDATVPLSPVPDYPTAEYSPVPGVLGGLGDAPEL